MTNFFLKSVKKIELLSIYLFPILYTGIIFYDFINKEITLISFSYRLIIPIALFSSIIILYKGGIKEELPIFVAPLFILLIKYPLYLALILGIIFELSPNYKHLLCSKKEKISSILFHTIPTKENCIFKHQVRFF